MLSATFSVYFSNTKPSVLRDVKAVLAACAEESAGVAVEGLRKAANDGAINRTDAISLVRAMVQRYGE
jgi:hypothetical protein